MIGAPHGLAFRLSLGGLLSGALAAELAEPLVLIGQRRLERLHARAERLDLADGQATILMRPAGGIAHGRADLSQRRFILARSIERMAAADDQERQHADESRDGIGLPRDL